MSLLEKRPGLHSLARARDLLNGTNLGNLHGFRNVAGPEDIHDARGFQNGQPFFGIEAAEYVTREKRKVEDFRPARALCYCLVERRESRVSLAFKPVLHGFFKVRTHVDREPLLPFVPLIENRIKVWTSEIIAGGRSLSSSFTKVKWPDFFNHFRAASICYRHTFLAFQVNVDKQRPCYIEQATAPFPM